MAWQIAEYGSGAQLWAYIIVGPVLVILLCIGMWWIHRSNAPTDDKPTERKRTDDKPNPFGDSN